MAELQEHQQKILDEFKQTLAEKVADAHSALADLNMVERRYGLEQTSLDEFVLEDRRATPAESLPAGVRKSSAMSSVQSGAFVGHLPLEAAKKYIDMVKRAVDFDEIVNAITKGNAAIPTSTAWQEDLTVSLGRSPDVLKVGDRTYGLIKFYTKEQIEAERAARRPAPAKAKKKKRKRAKRIAEKKKGPPELKLLESPAKNSATGEA